MLVMASDYQQYKQKLTNATFGSCNNNDKYQITACNTYQVGQVGRNPAAVVVHSDIPVMGSHRVLQRLQMLTTSHLRVRE